MFFVKNVFIIFIFLKTLIYVECLVHDSKNETGENCKVVVDVGFILDSSGSLKEHYGKEKEILKTLAASFELSANGSRAGVVTFSNTAEHSIKLDDHNNLDSFNDAVDAIRFFGHTTRIDRALKVTRKNMFNKENSGRKGVEKLVILLTDGTQTKQPSAEDPAIIANEIRNEGIQIMAVGVGKDINITELAEISGGEKNVFTVASFDELIERTVIQKLKDEACYKVKKPDPKKCRTIVDVGFILDSSGSLKRHYQEEKDILNSIAGTFDISVDNSRAGVVTFSTYTKHSIKLNEHKNVTSFYNAVNEIELMGHTTRIDRALRTTQAEMFSLENGGRLGVPKLLILLTDGTQTKDPDAEDPAIIARELQNDGIRVLVIGIGRKINTSELIDIAGDKSNVYIAASFEELRKTDFVARIKDQACIEAKKPVNVSCRSKYDVGFILDSSGSLKKQYQFEKDVLKILASLFEVSLKDSRIGVISFSSRAEHAIKLNDHDNINSFNKAVDKIPLLGHTTRIDRALRMSINSMFISENGGREGVQKLLILLTDGTQSDEQGAEDPAFIAEELRNNDVRIIAVGIGSKINMSELVDIVGDNENVYTADTFEEFTKTDLVRDLRAGICKKDDTPRLANVGCSLPPLDIVFAFDVSNNQDNVERQKNFAKIVLPLLKKENFTNIAVVRYAKEVETVFSFNANYQLNESNLGDIFSSPKSPSALSTMVNKSMSKVIEKVYNNLLLPKHNQIKFQGADGNNALKRPFVSQKILALFSNDFIDKSNFKSVSDMTRLLHDIDVHFVYIGDQEENDYVSSLVIPTQNYFISHRNNLSAKKFLNLLCKTYAERPNCNGAVDLLFAIDASASMERDFPKQINLVKRMTSDGIFHPTEEGFNLALLEYSRNAKIRVLLKDGNNQTSFINGLSQTKLQARDTRIDNVLEKAKKVLFLERKGARKNLPKVLILFIDGRHTNPFLLPFQTAENLKALGVTIVIFGLSGAIDRKQLAALASKDSYLYVVDDFDKIDNAFLGNFKESLCADLRAVPPFDFTADDLLLANRPDKSKCDSRFLTKIRIFHKMLKSGLEPSWLANFLEEHGYMSKLVKHFNHVNNILKKLNGHVEGEKSQMLYKSNQLSTCQSSLTNKILDSVISDDNTVQEDILTTALHNNGSKFVNLLWVSGISSELLFDRDNDLTFLIPHDSAWNEANVSFCHDFKKACWTKDIIRFHILKGRLDFKNISKKYFVNVMGKALTYRRIGEKHFIGDAMILSQAVLSMQGTAYVIDRVLTLDNNKVK